MITKRCVLKEGDEFGFLIVKDYDKGCYICECECGNIVKTRSWTLKTGRTKSCGCKQEHFRQERVKKNEFKGIKNDLYRNYKSSAKRRGYSFELTKEEFLTIISHNCYYCGASPSMTYTYGSGNTLTDYTEYRYNGVDRVDNKIGYINDNVVSCCKICNNSKASLSINEWHEWIDRIHKYKQST